MCFSALLLTHGISISNLRYDSTYLGLVHYRVLLVGSTFLNHVWKVSHNMHDSGKNVVNSKREVSTCIYIIYGYLFSKIYINHSNLISSHLSILSLISGIHSLSSMWDIVEIRKDY